METNWKTFCHGEEEKKKITEANVLKKEVPSSMEFPALSLCRHSNSPFYIHIYRLFLMFCLTCVLFCKNFGTACTLLYLSYIFMFFVGFTALYFPNVPSLFHSLARSV